MLSLSRRNLRHWPSSRTARCGRSTDRQRVVRLGNGGSVAQLGARAFGSSLLRRLIARCGGGIINHVLLGTFRYGSANVTDTIPTGLSGAYMTDNADGGGGPDRDPPDIPAYTPDVWHHTSTLPGTMSVGGSRAEMAANHIARLAAGVQAGERIGSKDDIRHVCGVSVGTVNEAIKLAQERGIITSRPGPGGGIFASDPSPLSRMNGWFRSAASDYSALDEAIQIRDALAPLLVDEVLARITDADQRVLNAIVDRGTANSRCPRPGRIRLGGMERTRVFRWYRAQPTPQQSLSEHHGRRDLASAGASGSRRRDRAKRAGCRISRGLPRSLRISSRLSVRGMRMRLWTLCDVPTPQ